MALLQPIIMEPAAMMIMMMAMVVSMSVMQIAKG